MTAGVDVVRAGNIFKFSAGEALRQSGEVLASVRLGVEGLITPWNFPIAIPAWKIAPALAHGNTVVFKPAELVPGSAWALAEILQRAGLPRCVLNLVMGRGSVVGQAMLDDAGIHGISFTGSRARLLHAARAVHRQHARHAHQP